MGVAYYHHLVQHHSWYQRSSDLGLSHQATRHQAVHDKYKKTTYLGIIECDQLLRVLRFYPKDWTLFTFSGVSGCLRHYSVATCIRGVGVITKGSRHGPT